MGGAGTSGFNVSRAGVRGLVGVLSAAACLACGGPSALTKLLTENDKVAYGGACRDANKKQTDALMHGDYVPARLFVHTWPKATAPNDLFVPESRLAAALAGGELKKVFVTARGGLGKTSLAESLRGQLCGNLPVFFLDLKDVAKLGDKAGEGEVGALIGKQAGVPAEGDLNAEFLASLSSGPFVLFADSIEETDLVARPSVSKALQAFAARYPNATVVLLARPPVLDDDYGFAADTKLEIPPLECKVTDEFLAKQAKNEEEREEIKAVMKKYGLYEQSRFGVQCVLPYLSTYRDVKTMVEFFRKARQGDVLTSFSSVYEALIGQRLKKEFDNLRWTASDALDMGDRLVRAAIATQGQAAMRFDLALCEKAIDPRWGDASVDAGVAGGAAERKRHVCEKTFQSAMFQRGEGSGGYVFADRATQELFLGRWINGEIARAPGQDCATLDKQKDLLANLGVLRIVVGQPLGQRCLGHAIAHKCTQAPDAVAEFTTAIEQGVVSGKARAQVLQEARAAASGLQPKACIDQVLGDLDRTISE
ncbi:MAG: hypothetical protein FJ100_02355 [Deltaproteobacteria bacterium]|nr:hypothetical protein [Deltaproteobacteria bacterium]